MSSVLYLAKINLITDDIFEVYKNKHKLNEICNEMYLNLRSEVTYIDLIPQIIEGNEYEKEIEYTLHILGKTDLGSVEGYIYRKSELYYKELNEKNNKITVKSVPNIETIRFFFDTNRELIAFYTTNRFGYRNFIKAFAEILNKCMNLAGSSYRFSCSLCQKGLNINEIKNELSKINKITEIVIRVQPPNPQDKLLEEILKNAEDKLNEYNESNITSVETKFTSKGENGININSDLINENLNLIDGIHSCLSDEEALGKGYVELFAKNDKGVSFTTEDSKPFKGVSKSEDSFIADCENLFEKYLN